MYDKTELTQRLIIIKHAELEDAVILDNNYVHLIKDAYNPDDRDQLKILHTNTQRRIVKLCGKD